MLTCHNFRDEPQIQTLLGVTPDGNFGPATRAAFETLQTAPADKSWPLATNATHPTTNTVPLSSPHPPGDTAPWNSVLATSFADPADVAAFRRCKSAGHPDEHCFAVGDNGLGCWGDDLTGPTPACALPPEVWLARWGRAAAAHNQPVIVSANARTVTCLLQDTMPHQRAIRNGAGLDLNPAAVAALGLHPPLKIPARWRWATPGEDTPAP